MQKQDKAKTALGRKQYFIIARLACELLAEQDRMAGNVEGFRELTETAQWLKGQARAVWG